MSTRPSVLLVLLALGGCATAQPYAMGPVPPPMPAPAPAPSQSPIAYNYGTGPVVVDRYESQPAPMAEPIRAPGTVLPGQGLYGTDPGMQGMAEGNTDQAELDFEKALEVNPFDAVALNNLAVAKAERGQFHEATALLERAVKLQPNNAEVAANLARLRGYVQGYAMAGVNPSLPKSANGPLPPAPPSLWGTYSATPAYSAAPIYSYSAGAPVGEAVVMPATTDSGYYTSEACKRKASGSGKGARVDIECEPRR